MRVVLDTNVVLDWLVFRDVGVQHIVSALEAGHITAWTNAACEHELERVLGYPKFALTEPVQDAAIATFRRAAQRCDGPAVTSTLPRCDDPDDQKFLELARDARASFLVTKDKSLLTLSRARYALRGFRIVKPAGLEVPLPSNPREPA
jgi:uncharacterized protein